jgi:hypothetical protein
MNMEGQRERTSSRRRQRRKSKNARGKIVIEPVLIAARRPDSPLLKNAFRDVIASAQPKPQPRNGLGHARGARAVDTEFMDARDGSNASGEDQAGVHGAAIHGGAAINGAAGNGAAGNGAAGNGAADGVDADDDDFDALESAGEGREARDSELPPADDTGKSSAEGQGPRRRAVRIVKAAEQALGPSNREQQLLDRLMRSQGRGAISRAANDLWESKFVAPKKQEFQIQLLEHENEHRARDAVFIMAELLQRESPIQRPVLDQRLRRLEQSAEDPITRDAAGALRRSMRVHHGA